MKFNIDIKELYQEFKKEYNLIYNSDGYIPRYSDAVKAFDNFLEDEDSDDIVCDFVSYHWYPIFSDDEAAAFMFAMETLADNFDLDKYLDKNPDSLLTPVYRGGHWIYE